MREINVTRKWEGGDSCWRGRLCGSVQYKDRIALSRTELEIDMKAYEVISST